MNIIVPYLTGDGYFILEGDGWCHYTGNGSAVYRRGRGSNNTAGPSTFGRARGLSKTFAMKCIIIRR